MHIYIGAVRTVGAVAREHVVHRNAVTFILPFPMRHERARAQKYVHTAATSEYFKRASLEERIIWPRLKL